MRVLITLALVFLLNTGYSQTSNPPPSCKPTPVYVDTLKNFCIKYYKGGIIEVEYTSPKNSEGFEITLMSGTKPVKVYYTGKMKIGEIHTITISALNP